MQARPALTRYPTAGARIECSTGKTSKLIPQILISVRSLIRCRSSMWQFCNERHVFWGGVDWAGRAVSQTPGVIGMRMGQHNRVRMKPLEFPHPIEPAVDHHSGAAIGE